ncbi:MAG: hypothetical protein HGA61_03700 [Candidatus Moranbacteria bacterium]|nr:hypothetical protein [Candidatus Moranbacteria bacterium]
MKLAEISSFLVAQRPIFREIFIEIGKRIRKGLNIANSLTKDTPGGQMFIFSNNEWRVVLWLYFDGTAKVLRQRRLTAEEKRELNTSGDFTSDGTYVSPRYDFIFGGDLEKMIKLVREHLAGAYA